MKSASLNEIKQELQNLSLKQMADICLRLAKYKKENKELNAYLLFEAHNAEAYTKHIKENMDEMFKDVNTANLYFAKKTLRKILRQANKHIKYISIKPAEAEIRIHFCYKLKATGIALHKNKALNNIYLGQLKKIKTALAALHEDEQYDFMKQLQPLYNYQQIL